MSHSVRNNHVEVMYKKSKYNFSFTMADVAISMAKGLISQQHKCYFWIPLRQKTMLCSLRAKELWVAELGSYEYQLWPCDKLWKRASNCPHFLYSLVCIYLHKLTFPSIIKYKICSYWLTLYFNIQVMEYQTWIKWHMSLCTFPFGRMNVSALKSRLVQG